MWVMQRWAAVTSLRPCACLCVRCDVVSVGVRLWWLCSDWVGLFFSPCESDTTACGSAVPIMGFFSPPHIHTSTGFENFSRSGHLELRN